MNENKTKMTVLGAKEESESVTRLIINFRSLMYDGEIIAQN